MNTRPLFFQFLLLGLTLICAFALNLSMGSVSLDVPEVFRALFNSKGSETTVYLVQNYRLPKAFTAILCGGGLSVCGLLMQTLFRNPLAGPFVLGLSSGAGLGVALLFMGSALFGFAHLSGWVGELSVALAAGLGSFLVLLLVLLVASRVRDTMALLIIGLMLGSLSAAVVSLLSYFTTAQNLQLYIFWTYGSLGNLNWTQFYLLAISVAVCLGLLPFVIRPLNTLLLGESNAQSLGVNLKKTRFAVIVISGVVVGVITAFVGPIAFVGLAVPHLTRQIFPTVLHQFLLPAVFLYGAIVMLLCDIVAQWPFGSATLPINAITSLFGAPLVIWLLLKQKKMLF